VTDRVAGPRPGPQASAQGLDRPEQDGPARIWARTRHTYGQGTWSLRRRLGYAFAVAAGLLAVGCLLGGLALNSMISAVNLQINRLDPAARDTSSLLSSLLTAENGVRGYIITRQQSFLTPYHNGLAHTTGYLAGLHKLIGPYPDLARRLGTVETRASLWRTDYAQPAIATVSRNGTVSSGSETTGNQDFASARAAIAALNKEILAERDAALRRLHSATTDVIVLAITGAALLIAAGAAAWAAMNAWVTGPLAALGGEAQVVASGGLGHVLNVSGPREIMELAADVEAMRRQLLSGLDDLSFKATELERSNRELEQYAYVASHDLQEPLRKVASFCQMLESRYAGQLDDRARQYIAFAVDGARRMQLLINELLKFSRVGQPGTVRGPVDLNAVASGAAERLDATIADADAQIIVGDLPTVDGDQTLLTQLFQNLIANSIKFRRLDEHPVVRITAEQGDGVWMFACRDNGIGIAPAHAERVFVIFQRLHPREAYPGTGLGLALCRKIVDFHGGHIWIDTSSATSEGTTIRWTLPASDGHMEGRAT
jgi:signal transduction histidine kinase